MKGKVTAFKKENIQLRQQIVGTDQFIKMTKEQIDELKQKELLGEHDRDELFRDSSTYQVNYAKQGNNMLSQQIDYSNELIKDRLCEVVELAEVSSPN